MDRYVLDLETSKNADESECWVWAWGCTTLDTDEFWYDNNLDSLMSFLATHNGTYYFHNLKYDGGYILDWLFRNKFDHQMGKWYDLEGNKRGNNKLEPYHFSTIISDMNQFYRIGICFDKGHSIEIIDSLKIINKSVSSIAETFDFEIQKGEIDYELYRPEGWKITDEELSYLERDCKIVAKALDIFIKDGYTQMTQGGIALHKFKTDLPIDFRKYFPIITLSEENDKKSNISGMIECDKQLRQSYRGGICWVNPKYQGLDIGIGIVVDKNSMYPTHMRYDRLPYGVPQFFKGEYKPDKVYPAFIAMISFNFEIKADHIPCIQIKNAFSNFVATEWLTSSEGEQVTLCLTSVDWELINEQYYVYNVEWHSGFKFKTTRGIFDDYIDYWYKVKEEATISGNKGLREIAKLMLNSLYGKLAVNCVVKSKVPYFDQESMKVKYAKAEDSLRRVEYLPVASFITAGARADLVRAAQNNYDRVMYMDTDSLHLIGKELPEGLELHPTKLGAWDVEMEFTRARYLGQKCYIEDSVKPDKKTGRTLVVKCAGMPRKLQSEVTWDNFFEKLKIDGALKQKVIKGGVILKKNVWEMQKKH